MATAAFKSTSKRQNSSSSSLKETTKPHPRRSRSVSAVSRSHDDSHSSSDFLIKRDNPLYWSNVSPPAKEISSNLPAEDDRRGRSLSRNVDSRSNVSNYTKGVLPKVDTGRRRSVSRGPVDRTRPLKTLSDVPGVSLLTRYRNGSDSDGSSSVSRKSTSVRSDSHNTREQVQSLPVSPQGSTTKLYGLEDDASSCIYETVRSEVRRAIADIQNDLGSAIIRSNATNDTGDAIVDLLPDLVNPGAVELVLDIRRDYSRKLEQSLEHARELRAELEVEEQRSLELSRILKEVLPDPKNSNMRRSRQGRKSSIERRKMSKRLTEEAIAYFDECISLSTFDSSDFESQDEPPISIVGNKAPVGDSTSLSEGSTSVAATQCSPYNKQEWDISKARNKQETTGALETRRFSFARNESELQHEYMKNVQISRYKDWNMEEYKSQASADSFLHDTLLLKSKTNSGTILVCTGGVAISLWPVAYAM